METKTQTQSIAANKSAAACIEISSPGQTPGALSISSRLLLRHLDVPRTRINIGGAKDDHPDDEAVRHYIQKRYQKAFGAQVRISYPELIWISGSDNTILAAVGLRPADRRRLFLEQYIDEPIHIALQQPRSRIVEIGNLVSSNRSASTLLFAAVALLLDRRGVTIATATGTRIVRKRLESMGLALHCLGAAHSQMLNQSDDRRQRKDSWGSYYDNCPQVMWGSVPQCARHIRDNLIATLRYPAALPSKRHHTRSLEG